jgi:hypothetical protein
LFYFEDGILFYPLAREHENSLYQKYSQIRYPCNIAKYTVVYTEETEGGFSGRCSELPGAISQGNACFHLLLYQIPQVFSFHMLEFVSKQFHRLEIPQVSLFIEICNWSFFILLLMTCLDTFGLSYLCYFFSFNERSCFKPQVPEYFERLFVGFDCIFIKVSVYLNPIY